MEKIHIGGSGAVRFMDGQARSQLERNSGFMIYQAGLVIDADLAEDLSFWYDFNLIREGINRNDSVVPNEQIYVRWDSLFKKDWLNMKLGRTFTPYGEEYLRWNSIDNPLASWTVAFPWSLDEGVMLFGDILPDGRLSYAASVQNGGFLFNSEDNPEKSLALKLSGTIVPGFYVSGSFLDFSQQGSPNTIGGTEWWISGIQIFPFAAGAGTSDPAGPSPSPFVDGKAYEANVKIVTEPGQIWANYGYVDARDGGGPDYSRIIRYGALEILGFIPRTEKKLYLAGRYSVVGTFHPSRGYMFQGTEFAYVPGNINNAAPYAFGYDQRDLTRYTLGGGYKMTENTVIKTEYSWENTHLIEAAKTPENLSLRGQRNFFIVEMGFRF